MNQQPYTFFNWKSHLQRCCGLAFFFLTLFMLPNTAEASHYKGGQITYVDLGGGVYDVTMTSYIRATWGGTFGVLGNLNFSCPVNVITPLTPANTIANTTLLPDGITRESVQTMRVQLLAPGLCTVSTNEDCCRLAGGSNFNQTNYQFFAAINYDPAGLNSCAGGSQSSSPQFNDVPLFNFATGVSFNFSLNLTDPDGDPQQYSLSNPHDIAAPYGAMTATGFSVAANGDISWTNPQTGLWVVAVKIDEVCGGVPTGAFVIREFLLNVQPSANNAPICSAVADIVVDEGDVINFGFSASDPDVGNSLALGAGGGPFALGATFTQNVFGNPASGTFNWATTMGDGGVYAISLTATDDDGFFPLSCATNINITVEVVTDSIPPELWCVDTILANSDPGICGKMITYAPPMAIDNESPSDSIDVFQIGGLGSGSIFPVGETIETWVAIDEQGYSDTCSFVVRIEDNTPPMIWCITDITKTLTLDSCTEMVHYSVPMVTDNCEVDTIVLLSGLGANGNFPIGVTTECWVAYDKAGNTDTCCFTVTILDGDAPDIICPPDYVISADPDSCNAVFAYADPVLEYYCGGETVVQIEGIPNGGVYPKDSSIQVWVATDPAGNTDTCRFYVIVEDNQDPIISCPGDIITGTDIDECFATVSYAAPTVSDNCPDDVVVQIAGLPSGSQFPKDTTINTFVVTDCGGNTDTCSFMVIVSDDQDPVITCPGDIAQGTDPGLCVAVVNYLAPSVVDNCPDFTVVQIGGLASGSAFPKDTTINTFVVTDCGGNTDTCSFAVIITDDEDPIIACPGDTIVGTDPGLCEAVVNYAAPVASDNCPDYVVVQTAGLPSGSSFPKDTTINTFVVTDCGGNTATCSFMVIVQDDEDPVLSCPGDTVLGTDPGVCEAVYNYAVPTASDNCPGAVVTLVSGPAPGDIVQKGTDTVTYKVVDCGGNTVFCSWTVTVEDWEDPILICPSDVTYYNELGLCGATVYYAQPYTDDNCPDFVLELLDSSKVSGSFFAVGSHTLVYKLTDCGGNVVMDSFQVHVLDNEKPKLFGCPAFIEIPNAPGLCGCYPTYMPPFADDNCPGTVVTLQSGPAPGDWTPVGTTTVVYRATDAAGNFVECSFDIIINDVENPVITCPADSVLSTEPGICTANATYADPSAADNCTVDTVFQIAGLPSGSDFPKGVTTNTWVAIDLAGNADTCSFTITVEDNEPPTITCPADISVGTDAGVCDAVVNYAAPIVTDNCTPWTVVQTAGLASGSTFPKGVTTNTFVVTDCGGNVMTCSFTVTVSDDEDPVISCPGDITQGTDPGVCDAVVSYAAPSVSDNCPGWTVAQIAGLASGATFPKGLTTNTFVVTDCGGNTDTCSFDVNIFDDEPVSLNCPGNLNVGTDPGVCDAVVTYAAPIVTDNCSPVTVVQIAGLASGATFPKGSTVNTFVATDCGGFTDTCSFTVTVSDNEGPDISCPGDIIVGTDPGVCDAVVTYAAPTVLDNCPGWSVVQIAGLASGSTFPKDTTINTFVVTDCGGNTDTCSFSVIVEDNEPAVVVCPTDAIYPTIPGLCSGIAYYSDPFVSDNCPGVVVTRLTGLPSGSMFPVGSTTIVYQAVDCGGNVSKDSLVVTIVDTEAPVIFSCPISLSAPVAPGTCGCFVDYMPPGASDNCSAVLSRVEGPAPNDFFPIGETKVVWVATDPAGNTDTCSFTVTITDPNAPIVSASMADATVAMDDGAIDLSVAGGVGPFTYLWSNGATTEDISGLAPGDYTVDVTDARGCTVSSTYNVGMGGCFAPDGLAVTFLSPTRAKVCWNDPGNADYYTVCGRKAGSNNFRCSNLTKNCRSVSNLNPGATYEWYVEAHCGTQVSASANATFTMPNPRVQEREASLSLYPNPTESFVNVVYESIENIEGQVFLIDAIGRVISAEQQQFHLGTNTLNYTMANYPEGIYTVEVIAGDQKTIQKLVVTR